jgi:hypothetical protein
MPARRPVRPRRPSPRVLSRSQSLGAASPQAVRSGPFAGRDRRPGDRAGVGAHARWFPDGPELPDRHDPGGDPTAVSLRNSCTNWTAIAPSPTADATRLIDRDRRSPAVTDLDVEGPWRSDGVRLPGLADFLRESMPGEEWPFNLKLLRSQLPHDGRGGPGLETALERVARFPIFRIGGSMSTSMIGLRAAEQAAAELEGILGSLEVQQGRPDASESLICAGDHIAQACLLVGRGGWAYHQWIVFDDLWAAGHPDLADGVLRYAKRWDVLS